MPEERHDIKQKIQSQLNFEIIDPKNHIIAGYAATPLTDCDGDRCLLDAIHRAGKNYMDGGAICYAHHINEPAGEILDEWTSPGGKKYVTRFDKVGWYVVSRPTKKYWDMIQKGELNAFSTGWKRWRYSPTEKDLVVELEYDDLSYVPFPCTPLTFFNKTKGISDSSMFEDIKNNIERHLNIGVQAKTNFSSCKIRKTSKTNKFSTLNGGVKMETEELEVAKTKLIKKYPDAEDRIKAVDSEDGLKALVKELEEVAKPKTFEEKYNDIVSGIEESTKEKILKQLTKKRKEVEEEAKALDEEDRFASIRKELGVIKGRLDEVSQALGKLKVLEGEVSKIKEFTDNKGHGFQPQGNEPTLYDMVAAADLKSDPMALQKIGKSFVEPEEAA